MPRARSGAEITLSGPPRKAAAVVPAPATGERVVPLSITDAGQATIYRASVRPFGRGMAELRLRLPPDTPPGSYAAEGTVAGRRQSIVVEVEPVLRIRVRPGQSSVSGPPGSSSELDVLVMNAGNVPFDVPETETLDLDDAIGQDRALGRALRASLSGDERRVDRLFEELKESHGGEGRIAVSKGAGRLEPGESRELACRFEVPATAEPGRTYQANWELGNTLHVIVVDVTRGTRPRNGRAKP